MVPAADPAAGLPLSSKLLRLCRRGAGAPWRRARRLACDAPFVPVRPLAPRRLRPGTMRMDTQRVILLFIFSFSLLMLWEAWDKQSRPKPAPTPPAQQGVPAPAKPAEPGAKAAPPSAVPAAAPAAQGDTVRVRTDLIVAEIDTLGGTLKRVELLRHKESKDSSD